MEKDLTAHTGGFDFFRQSIYRPVFEDTADHFPKYTKQFFSWFPAL